MRALALILVSCSLLGMLACGGSGSSSSTISTVSVTCSPTSLQSGQTSQCTAAVTGSGTYSSVVVWGTSGGAITQAGVLTAPPVTNSFAVTVTATSAQDPTRSGTATVTVTPITAIAVSCSPSSVQPRQTSQCIASANGVAISTVNWSSTIGTISSAGVFLAPPVTGSTQATITAVTQTGNLTASTTVTVNVNNTVPIFVDGGPSVNGVSVGYVNGAYTTVTVCTPNTTTCQAIDHVLVDTGSVGLRILSSALNGVSLLGQNASDGNPLAECYVRPDGYAWGPVSSAQVQIAGEIATSLPVQVIAPSGFVAAPVSCSTQTTGGALQNVSTLKANGILGIGLWKQDCGTACAPSGSAQNIYYSCPTSGCSSIPVDLGQQVANPVSAFLYDNNGTMIQLPSVFSSGAPSARGSLIFGIGTQPNNGLLNATVYGVNPSSSLNPGTFASTFSNNLYPGAISSGANANYFLNSALTGLPGCSTSGYYCPSSDQTLSVTNAGTNGTSAAVSLVVSNADTLLASGNRAFSNLGGPGTGRTGGFLFGLPFFYGRIVYTAIDGASTSGGNGPYFAY